MKRIINIITTVLILISVLLLFAFNGTRFFGYTPYVVTSGSMEPMYPVGSLIYVKEVDPMDIEVGDSITFYKQGESTATHQVYEIDEANKQFRTQGINNFDEKGNILHDAMPVDFNDLVGKPVLCIPKLGIVNAFCTSRTGQVTLIGIAVVMIIVSMIFGEEKGERK